MAGRAIHSTRLTLAALLGLAVALRLPGLFSDFWLDEIWTLKIVLSMDSAWEVFSEVRHSNNHHLNTLFFYLVGDVEQWSLYRGPALLAGLASVGLAFRIGARRSSMEALVAGGLVATSYLLIHFSSEARGYAPMIFFGLASFSLLEDFPEASSWRRLALFWLCTVLGFLSHLMYLHVFVASAAWMALRLHRSGRLVPGLLRLFALPCVFLFLFYWFDIRLTKIGDGPEFDAPAVFLRAASYALGGPASGLVATAVALSAVLSFSGAIAWWARQGRDEWLFLAIAIFVSPALSYVLMGPEVFFVRYFLISAAFGLIALAAPLARALESGGIPKLAAGALVAAMLLGNGLNVARFYRDGRGDYLETVRLISTSAGSRLPTVGSDHRFRNHNVIRFYNRYLPADRRLVYQDQDEHPEWWLAHRIGDIGEVPQTRAGDGRSYDLVRVARYADLSGWHWLVYRRRD